LRAWRDEGKRLYVYSSGSVQAQELFFRHSEAGDLHALFDGFFDTEMGAKRDAASYRRIAEAIGVAPGEILFLSDIAEDSMRRAPPACTQRYLRARRRSARSMETIVARPTSMA
jgi:enolase-phosphatase E1